MSDHLKRLELIAYEGETLELGPDDLAAIRWGVKALGELRKQLEIAIGMIPTHGVLSREGIAAMILVKASETD